MAEGGGELGHLDGRVADADVLAGEPGRLAGGEVAHARVVRLDAVVDPPDPRRALAHLAGPVAGHEHHGGGAVGDRRAVAGAERRHDGRLGEHVVGRHVAAHLRERVARAALRRLRAATSARSASVPAVASSRARAWSAASDTWSAQSGIR